jgi:tetratricopeptide (TPR) repeat protein
LRLVAAKLNRKILTAPTTGAPVREVNGWLAVATMFEALQLYDEQVESTRRAVATGDPLARVRAVELALLAGDVESAQGLLQSLLDSDERSERILRDLAYAHAHLAMAVGDVQAARSALELTGDWNGRAGLEWLAFAVAGRQLDIAVVAAEHLLEQARLGGPIGNPEVERVFMLVHDLVDIEGAAERILELAERLPTDGDLSPLARLKVRALLYDRLGRFDEAVEASMQVERLGILDFELMTLRLRGLRRLGQTERAERLQRRLRKLDPGFNADPVSLSFG